MPTKGQNAAQLQGVGVSETPPNNGDVMVYDAGLGLWKPAPPAGGGLVQQAVVDIGPTTNNGPGDQTKGLYDCNATPPVIVVAPGANKFIQFIAASVQYKAGAAAYTGGDSGTQLGLIWLPDDDIVMAETGLGGTQQFLTQLKTLTSRYWGWQELLGFALGRTSGGVSGTSEIVMIGNNIPANQSLNFGDFNSRTALATGDGQLRIYVEYAIHNLLV
jgi:hypothetical protein